MTELLLKKCDNDLCRRAVKTSVAYCCDPCFLAGQGHYEIHEAGPLAHTSFCDQRHAERGDFHACWACGGTNTTYQSFSGGREYYCRDCDDTFPYEEGTTPRRIQMLADGKTAELREEMREELHSRKECCFGRFCFRQGGDTGCWECRPGAAEVTP